MPKRIFAGVKTERDMLIAIFPGAHARYKIQGPTANARSSRFRGILAFFLSRNITTKKLFWIQLDSLEFTEIFSNEVRAYVTIILYHCSM